MLSLIPLLAFQDIQVDPLLLVEAQEVWSVIGRPDNPVWPGWDARKTPILIYFPGKQDLLVNHPNPPQGFELYSGPIRSTIGPIYVKDGTTIMEFDGQNTSTDVNGTQTLVIADTLSTRRQWAIGLADAITANPNSANETVAGSLFPDPYSAITMFAHEAFHVYQHKMAPNKGGNELALIKYPSLSVENNVGFALEADLLAEALSSTSESETRTIALKWLAVRQWRRGIIGETASAYEDGTEFNEGTAKYVEYRLLQSLEGRQPSPEMWLIQGFRGFADLSGQRSGLVRQMKGFMKGTNSVNNDLYGASPVRFRLYYSGMGIGALLDQLGADWHDQIFKPDTSLTDLASQALHPTKLELDAALASVKATPRFAVLVREKTHLASDGEKYAANEAAKFESAAGELVIDYSQLTEPKVGFAFTPFGILRVDDDRTLFRLIPIRGIVNELSFAEDGPRPIMQDTRLKVVHLSLTSAPNVVDICGQLGVSELPDKVFAAPRLQLPGVLVEKVRGRITVEGRRIVIQLSD